MRRLALGALAIGLVATGEPTASARTDALSQPQEVSQPRVRDIQVRLDLPRGAALHGLGLRPQAGVSQMSLGGPEGSPATPTIARDVFGSGKVSLVRIALRDRRAGRRRRWAPDAGLVRRHGPGGGQHPGGQPGRQDLRQSLDRRQLQGPRGSRALHGLRGEPEGRRHPRRGIAVEVRQAARGVPAPHERPSACP